MSQASKNEVITGFILEAGIILVAMASIGHFLINL